MTWTAAPMPRQELILAQGQPWHFLLRRTLLFASFFVLLRLVFQLIVPGVFTVESPGRTLFTALGGGVFGSVLLLVWARHSPPPTVGEPSASSSAR